MESLSGRRFIAPIARWVRFPITIRTYFKLSLLCPVVVPWICMLAVDTVSFGSHEFTSFLVLMGCSFFPIALIYIPTAAIFLLPWISRCSLRSLHITVLTAPLIMCGSLLLVTVVLTSVSAVTAVLASMPVDEVLALALGIFVLCSYYIVLIGYCYVALTYIVYLPLRLVGLVRSQEPA